MCRGGTGRPASGLRGVRKEGAARAQGGRGRPRQGLGRGGVQDGQEARTSGRQTLGKGAGAGKQGPVSKQETYVPEAEAQHTFRRKQTEVRSEKDVETS